MTQTAEGDRRRAAVGPAAAARPLLPPLPQQPPPSGGAPRRGVRTPPWGRSRQGSVRVSEGGQFDGDLDWLKENVSEVSLWHRLGSVLKEH